MVEHPLRDQEVVGSNPGRAIPRALKMVPVASPRSILVFSGRYHIISNASIVNNCIILHGNVCEMVDASVDYSDKKIDITKECPSNTLQFSQL